MAGLNRVETMLLTATGLVLVIAALWLAAPGAARRASDPGVPPPDRPAPDRRSEWPAGIAAPRVRERPPSDPAARRAVERLRVEHEQLTLPFREDALSSVVKTVVPPGDALVMGGYPTADGRHEFTFLTPRTLGADEGGPAVLLEARVVALSPDEVAALGMDTLASPVRNSLQHAETWNETDVRQTLEGDGLDTIASPALSSVPGEGFAWKLEDGAGGLLTIEGRAEALSDGTGTLVEAAVVRREPAP